MQVMQSVKALDRMLTLSKNGRRERIKGQPEYPEPEMRGANISDPAAC